MEKLAELIPGGNLASILIFTVAIYLALFAHVAFSPKISRRLIAAAAGVVVVVGLVFYGACFASLGEHVLLSTLKTCHAVFSLFLGENSADAIENSPLLAILPVEIIFHGLNFLGIFATAGAAISAIGAKFLRSIRLLVQTRKPVAVIHPLTPNTLEFARELMEQHNSVVVFADENPDSSCTETAAELGCVVRSDSGAVDANAQFLGSIGIRGKRKVCLYALSADRFANRDYAGNFLEALRQRHISMEQTSLTIFAEEDETENSFSGGDYSYGSVLCVNEEYMAARMLLKKAPLYETMTFDENGRATRDFHALVVGSGNVGQAVIKQLVMNGQFAGSHFRLTVFDPEFDAITGRMRYECENLFQEYDIRVEAADARSDRMFRFLSEAWQDLNYVVVCTGSDDSNREICRQLLHFFSLHRSALPLYICSSRGLQRISSQGAERWGIFTADVLCTDQMDRRAMLLNQAYCEGNGKNARENWAVCDYFSRMSSRASADFAPAFLKMAGLSADTVPEGDWMTPAQLENMAISEHERWCAFHYCMGFRAMTREEFDTRCRIYLEEKAKDPKTRYRIGKDLTARVHCCLIPWEALDDLSERENAVTGKNTDYKQMDRNNVLMLPQLLRTDKL